MNMRGSLQRLSGRSRSARPPRPAVIAPGDVVAAGPDASHGVILYLEEITVSFDASRPSTI